MEKTVCYKGQRAADQDATYILVGRFLESALPHLRVQAGAKENLITTYARTEF